MFGVKQRNNVRKCGAHVRGIDLSFKDLVSEWRDMQLQQAEAETATAT